MRFRGLEPIARLGGDSGLVAVDRRGNVATPFNSAGMDRACVNGERTIALRR